MKLADLRKLAIRRQLRIRFALGNGMECVVDQHGVARVPALRGVPDFDLEVELAAASQFILEPVVTGKDGPKPRTVVRDDLATLANAAPSADSPAHDDE